MTNNRIQRYTISGDIAYPIHEDPEGDYVMYEDHVAAMQSPEIQALRKDAERYRATRAAMLNEDDELPRLLSEHGIRICADPLNPTPDEIDQTYDAAMKEKK